MINGRFRVKAATLITCLKPGAPVEKALELVTKMWENPFDTGKIEELAEEIDEEEDPDDILKMLRIKNKKFTSTTYSLRNHFLINGSS